jgi:hypothetical protein
MFCKLSMQIEACSILKSALRCAWYNPCQYNTHYFIIVAAVTAVMLGKTADQIKQMCRWKSNTFQKYIRLSFYSTTVTNDSFWKSKTVNHTLNYRYDRWPSHTGLSNPHHIHLIHRGVTRFQACSILKSALRCAWYNPCQYNTHSFIIVAAYLLILRSDYVAE